MVPQSKFELNQRLQLLADVAAQRRIDQRRRRCFISYHVDDRAEVETFLSTFGSEFIGKCIGITERDDFINSPEPEYIKRRIRELYLADTTVTIVLLGKCTWARQFVDWEISSTLRDDSKNTRSGLLAFPLPSMNGRATLPKRISDNLNHDERDTSYALFGAYPQSLSDIRYWIERAFHNRLDNSKNVNNSRELLQTNLVCK